MPWQDPQALAGLASAGRARHFAGVAEAEGSAVAVPAAEPGALAEGGVALAGAADERADALPDADAELVGARSE